jgi:hypothetical protein
MRCFSPRTPPLFGPLSVASRYVAVVVGPSSERRDSAFSHSRKKGIHCSEVPEATWESINHVRTCRRRRSGSLPAEISIGIRPHLKLSN